MPPIKALSVLLYLVVKRTVCTKRSSAGVPPVLAGASTRKLDLKAVTVRHWITISPSIANRIISFKTLFGECYL